jgi:hypothetical protein
MGNDAPPDLLRARAEGRRTGGLDMQRARPLDDEQLSIRDQPAHAASVTGSGRNHVCPASRSIPLLARA